ncbi:MAG: pyruvate kinase [Alphaproteobacteria bacterium]
MRRHRNAKIVVTLGPATSSPQTIEELFQNGADVFRLNFSHGDHETHAKAIEAIRALEKKCDRPIGLLMDLQGPKLRLGEIRNGTVRLEKGARYRLDLSPEPGDARRAPLPHPEVFAAIKPKQELLIDDGKVRLEVEECGEDFADTKVITGGEISDHKGVNVPDVVLAVAALTEKDRGDLEFALDNGADWVGLSFIQRPDDVAAVRDLVDGRIAILAKLEKPMAMARLDDIIELSDAVMVARGDLGVEMAPEEVPSLQKRIIRACRLAGKPVIVATQMLDSMVHAPRPTRAEASDVATAVYDGADAVMLSEETATGDYPVESVAMMERIIKRVEADPLYRTIMDADHPGPQATTSDAITAAARQAAETVSAVAIVTFTTSGSTTLRASRERPGVPILGLTGNIATARRLVLGWGVHSVHTADVESFSDMVEKGVHIAFREEFAETGGRLVITAGVPFGISGTTNILRIAEVKV